MWALGYCGAMVGPKDVCLCQAYERRTVVPERFAFAPGASEAIDRAEASCTCTHSYAMHLTVPQEV